MAGKSIGSRLTIAADGMVVVAAVLMVGFYVADRPRNANRTVAPPAAPDDWKAEISTGIALGPSNAKLTVIEFMDYECPFCARWAARVDSLLSEHSYEVQLVVHHYPLPNHPHALQAAVAVECAHEQGQYLEFQRVLFAQREQMGVKPWSDFAADAQSRNVPRFRDCIALPLDSFPRIAYGIELGKRVGIRGTPTVWVNGSVRQSTLEEMRAILKRDDP